MATDTSVLEPDAPSGLGRWASLAGGGALVFHGLRRGGLPGLGAAVLGGALAFRGAARQQRPRSDGDGRAILPSASTSRRQVHIESVVTVDGSADEMYRYWRDFENHPRFAHYVRSVTADGDTRSHWTMKAPVGPPVEWDLEVTDEAKGEFISWRTVEGSDVNHTGEVRFRRLPAERGTEVRMTMDFTPPGGAMGAAVGRLFDGLTEAQLRADLKRFKQLMETGEIATTEGQSSGRR